MKKFLLLIAVLLVGCTDTTDSIVPLYDVSYSCNIMLVNAVMEQTEQTQLNCQGGYVRIYDRKKLSASDIVGVGGLLILQNFEGAFFAYDLACPYCYQEGYTSTKVHRIDMKDDGLSAYCPSCGSEFGSVMWGIPASTAGDANKENLILRQYSARLLADGTTVLVTR